MAKIMNALYRQEQAFLENKKLEDGVRVTWSGSMAPHCLSSHMHTHDCYSIHNSEFFTRDFFKSKLL